MNNVVACSLCPFSYRAFASGSLRTALYNWLFARHYKGTFLLRIEDTDLERSKVEYTESIVDTLNWLAMEPDRAGQ